MSWFVKEPMGNKFQNASAQGCIPAWCVPVAKGNKAEPNLEVSSVTKTFKFSYQPHAFMKQTRSFETQIEIFQIHLKQKAENRISLVRPVIAERLKTVKVTKKPKKGSLQCASQ